MLAADDQRRDCTQPMGRINCTEIHEQPWLPNSLRDGITDGLQSVLSTMQVYQPIAGKLAAAVTASGAERVVDLCSGGGGPWPWLYRAFQAKNSQARSHVEIFLTDKFPNVEAFESIRSSSGGVVNFTAKPVEATDVPREIDGFRTIFSSFHHFTPEEASDIFRSAVDRGQGIGIFEAARRRPFSILLTFLMPLGALLFVPLIRPFRFSLFFWTYVIPVIPFVLWFDGLLSCLRAYLPDELRQIIAALPANDYEWEIGETQGLLSPVTYLLGYPVAKSPVPAHAVADQQKV
jgi:hypothetical protein